MTCVRSAGRFHSLYLPAQTHAADQDRLWCPDGTAVARDPGLGEMQSFPCRARASGLGRGASQGR